MDSLSTNMTVLSDIIIERAGHFAACRGDGMINDTEPKLSTEELLRILFKQTSLASVFENNEDSFGMQQFSEYISELCAERNEVPERIIERADLERSYGHKVFAGKRNPSRDTVLRLAFGFGADLELTQKLLKLARKSALYPRVKRDTVIIYCLYNRYPIIKTQLALEELGLPCLGEGKE